MECTSLPFFSFICHAMYDLSLSPSSCLRLLYYDSPLPISLPSSLRSRIFSWSKLTSLFCLSFLSSFFHVRLYYVIYFFCVLLSCKFLAMCYYIFIKHDPHHTPLIPIINIATFDECPRFPKITLFKSEWLICDTLVNQRCSRRSRSFPSQVVRLGVPV